MGTFNFLIFSGGGGEVKRFPFAQPNKISIPEISGSVDKSGITASKVEFVVIKEDIEWLFNFCYSSRFLQNQVEESLGVRDGRMKAAGWAEWPGAKMPIISTVIKTATVSLLCQNSLTVGAGRLSI